MKAGTDPGTGARAGVGPWVVLVGVLLVAANLRAPLAAYPPLLEIVRDALGISAGVAGAAQAGAVYLMGVGSFAAPAVAARVGWEGALGLAVAVLAAGCALRLVPVTATLVIGSVLVGGGIGSAGVLLTGVVKAHLADRAGTVTGVYVVAMMIGATVAGVVAVPLAVALGGWSRSLALWTVPAVLALGAWWAVYRRVPADRRAQVSERSALPWRDGFARLAALFMASTSVQFYGWLTWLSPYYQHLGWSPQRAALLQALWSVVQIPVALVVSALAERRRRWTFWAAWSLLGGVAGTAGALWWPQPPVLGGWVWAALMAVGVGAGFPLGLSVIAWRTPHGAAAGAASGLALGVGYLSAGTAPLLMGVLLDLTGGWPAPLTLLLVAGVTQALAIVLISRRPAPAAT